jgi:hypothetical protein
MRTVVSFATLSGLVLACASAHAGDPIKVTLPCGSAPFDSCETVKKRLLDGSDPSKPGGLHAWVKKMIEEVYAGKSKLGNGVACDTVASVGLPPICPPLKVGENGCVDEIAKNVKGESCPALSNVGYYAAGQIFSSLGKSVNGTRETANISGGLVLAISDRAADLEAQISKNEFSIAPSSGCFAQGKQLMKMVKDQSRPEVIAAIAQCSGDMSVCSAKKYFDSSMAALESAYQMVARCVLSDEAGKKFRSFADGYPGKIMSEVIRLCAAATNDSPTLATCYEREYATWIRTRAKGAFPRAAEKCPQ